MTYYSLGIQTLRRGVKRVDVGTDLHATEEARAAGPVGVGNGTRFRSTAGHGGAGDETMQNLRGADGDTTIYNLRGRRK